MEAFFSDVEIRIVAAQASTFGERVSGPYRPDPNSGTKGRQIAFENMVAWSKTATGEDGNSFEERLESYNCDENKALQFLGPVLLIDEAPLPNWAEAWRWIGSALIDKQTYGIVFFAESLNDIPRTEIPFEHLFYGLVSEAGRRAISDFDNLNPQLRNSFATSLLKRLDSVSTTTLQECFMAFRNSTSVKPSPSLLNNKIYYNSFITQMLNSELRELLLSYPVLARLIAQVTVDWIAATKEFWKRMKRDLPQITDIFGHNLNHESLDVIEVKICGDFHNEGRAVSIVTFSSGEKLVYKPRSLGVDVAWGNTLDFLSNLGAPLLPIAPKTLDQGLYGWAEFIYADPSVSSMDNVQYAEYSGALLALLYLLNATDMHRDNILIVNNRPVPIDLETLCSPQPDCTLRGDGWDIQKFVQSILRDTVSGIGFLPNWLSLPGGQITETGALVGKTSPSNSILEVVEINTDSMCVKSRNNDKTTEAYSAIKKEATSYNSAIIKGFISMHEYLLKCMDKLIAPEGPIEKFAGHPTRVVLRATNLYSNLLSRSQYPYFLSDGARWGASFDFLTRLTEWQDTDSHKDILEQELKWLTSQNVPLFILYTNGVDLLDNNGLVKSNFAITSPISKIKHRATNWINQKEQQLIVIKAVTAEVEENKQIKSWCTEYDHLTKEKAIDVARRVGADLDKTAIRKYNARGYLGLIPAGDERYRNFDVIQVDLYSGLCGIAIFYGALYEVDGASRWKESALECTKGIRDYLSEHRNREQVCRQKGIGGLTGVGSIIWALTVLADLLGDDSFIEDARLVATTITRTRIFEDLELDIVGGSAGATLACLYLYQKTGDKTALERAIMCGEHLISQQRSDGSWLTLGMEKPLLGFAHGASGIVLALSQLATVTGNQQFTTAFNNGLKFEREHFDPCRQNWPDYRDEDVRFYSQWCHGAVGVGLSRLALPEYFKDVKTDEEVAIAIQASLQQPRMIHDHLCCGNVGNLEFLARAGIETNRPEYIELALSRAGEITSNGSFEIDSPIDFFNPGLFQGISGCAYGLLRLTHPDKIPSVMTLGF